MAETARAITPIKNRWEYLLVLTKPQKAYLWNQNLHTVLSTIVREFPTSNIAYAGSQGNEVEIYVQTHDPQRLLNRMSCAGFAIKESKLTSLK